MKTQKERVLDRLKAARGEWVNYRIFLHDMMLSQAHARIHELQKEGYNIEVSDFRDEYNFVSYRLPVPAPIQQPLFASATA